ncbi:pyruvate kinase [bacterium]|nr:pyruvate kinase [bacterium]
MPKTPPMQKSRTKVVVTVGPACAKFSQLRALADAGASVYRLNFSHGDYESHSAAIANIRKVSERIGRPLAILADLSGPKLRIGEVPGGEVPLTPGDVITLTSSTPGSRNRTYRVNIKDFEKYVQAGQTVLLDDGMVKLKILETGDEDVTCEVQNKCVLRSRKGINLPHTSLPIPALTPKDRRDLEFALKEGVDLVALSFVRSPKDIELAKRAMRRIGREVPLIAKIEKGEALAALDEILELADGAMVARGDLGVEIPIHEVPSAQVRIIRQCNYLCKPVITATQMLNSMVTNPVPTRAEVTDIYNAILDGTDAVMLSNETAMGDYPIDAVRVMHNVSKEAERDLECCREMLWKTAPGETPLVAEAVSEAAVDMAHALELDAIICPTQSGATAMRVARFRPKCRILAFSTEPSTVGRLCLSWGVQTREMRQLWGTEEESSETDAIITAALRTARDYKLLKKGMRVVVLAGMPLRTPGKTNFLRVLEIE